ncbi:sulfite exporter TauE/SafE family protein [Candidatus Saccharibacteria bacterium]|nr:sulfite exporter TauE/SafE family protein [Candidatus Saccharibacteria bacterium]
MTLLFASFVAGILTILAPCVLPVIPVIVGGAATSSKRDRLRPAIIVASLGVSVLLFTLLLKASTVLLGVPQSVWQFVSSIIIIGLGLSYVFPSLWERLSLSSGGALGSQKLLSDANRRDGILGAVLTGAALGPVFTSCSPTYLFIVAAILPTEFWLGLLYLVAYVLGLTLVLLAAALLGSKVVKKLGWSVNPHGWFKRSVGVLMVIVGLLILMGGDKAFQTFVIDQGWYAPVESIENSLR